MAQKMNTPFEKMLPERPWLLADGATGSNLFNMGLFSVMGQNYGMNNIPRIRKLYQMAVDPGSDLFLTNSFGGNASYLKF